MSYWPRVCALAATAGVVLYAAKNVDSSGQKRELTELLSATNDSFDTKVEKANLAIKQYMLLNGVPGVSVGVSINGKTVWKAGVGLADIEQGVPCTGDTVMRIASISKPITAVILALLVQEGIFDVDAPIQKYVPTFPKKKFGGKEVEITSRHLMSHTSGIRHYKQAVTLDNEKGSNQKAEEKNSDNEFYLNKEFKTIEDSLKIFQDDDLEATPGSKFVYTTFGYTLLSAAMEKATGQSFRWLVNGLANHLGMTKTRLDTNLELVPGRARYYRMNDASKVENVPEVNNSYKWAGGGILSTVTDLIIFGNAIMYSHQAAPGTSPEPLLKKETVQKLLKGEIQSEVTDPSLYGWGWVIVPPIESSIAPNRTSFYAHTGGAVGASSVLIVRPGQKLESNDGKPTGTCVAILANMQNAGKGITPLALEISEIFCEDFQKP